MRLHNFFDKSGAAEDQIESFIVNISSSGLPSDKVIELVNQLHQISKTESVPLDGIQYTSVCNPVVSHNLDKFTSMTF
jgi:hypothetical protein